ncbi:accessory gene regulator B family protein [Hungatella sp.]|uniref:accessory gene regulator B family protein n=1 Tax=Hungatella sp. TaxID=2613924 RepID=UPI002A800384|nr:accessory gene regulator B family protein [Hungatella sp.]
MLRQFASYWTRCMILKGIINQEKELIYIYGLELFFSTLSSVLSMILISLITNKFLYGILFLFVTVPLKMTANGYHAKTFLKCFLLTNIIFIIYICLISLYPLIHMGYLQVILFIAAIIYIYIKAPVEHPKHKLSKQKREKNRLSAHIILAIDCLAVLVLIINEQQKAAYSFGIAIIIAACIMIIKNKEE